jgi:hypothetical protein
MWKSVHGTTLVIFLHALVGWGLCFATIGIGMAVTTTTTALVVHALLAPVVFAGVSLRYFSQFAYPNPLFTAVAFTGVVVALDFLVVALAILRSLDMFASPLGTWIPFASIFAVTWLTGAWVTSPGSSVAGKRG